MVMEKGSRMKNVLIVDDERYFLLSLVEGLGSYATDFNTLTAENGKKAVEILKSTEIDLVITDLKMPEMDGFELLAYMSKNAAWIPVIVMTAYSTPDIKAKLEKIGSFKVLEKPLDFKDLVDHIFTELATLSKGYIRGIALPAFLQLVEMEKKTCTLKIVSKGRTGYLYFSAGELMEADNGTELKEKAALDIVCWDEAEIEIDSICKEKTRNIFTTLSHILMDGFRLKDENSRGGNGDGLHKKGVAASQDEAGDFSSVLEEISLEEHIETSLKHGSISKEEAMANAKEILNDFAKLQGVDAVCLVGRDGFLLDSIARTGIDTEMIGAIASSGFGASESMGRQLGKGLMSISMIEFEKGPVMFSPVGDDAFLVIVAVKDSNLGMIRLKLKKHSTELATAAAI
jgi:predicted regulator of Ras-like GTPase activity (Roadblock/LC7/MglB family)/ActR/RegA family two-component response regulator